MTRVYQETITDAATGQTTVRDWTQEEIVAQTLIERAALAPLSRRQVFTMLRREGLLTMQEAEDAAASVSIPASIAGVFDALVASGQMTDDERADARITFRSFRDAYRTDPMVPFIVMAAPDPTLITDAVLDSWWQTYAQV